MITKLLLTTLLTFFAYMCSAQVTFTKVASEPFTKEVVEEDSFQFPGIEDFDVTYQFIVHNKKAFMLTSETFELIEQNRKEKSDTTLKLSNDLSVLIRSKSSIKAATFKPFETSYVLK